MAKAVTKPQPEALANAVLLPRDRIRANPEQPREYFEPGALAELAASIAVHGILQPLVVRYEPSRYDGTPYIILAGERRYRASEGILDKLPCIISDVPAGQARELALIENIQRQDLTELEEAKGVADLMTEHSLSQKAVARRLNMSIGWVTNRLSLLKTQPDVQAVAARVPHTMSSLLLIDAVNDTEEREALLEAVEDGASHSAVKARIEELSIYAKQVAATNHAPDRQTEQRAALNRRNGGGNVSRGRLVVGNSPQEAVAAVEGALSDMERALRTAESWWGYLKPGQLKQQQQRLRNLRESLQNLSD